MKATVAIVNYGMGNLHSVHRKFSLLHGNPVVVTTPAELLNADKIVLPGVGHFEKAITNLKQLGLFDALNEAVLIRKVPVLGICLGMQLLANESEEGGARGFGWVDARVVKFEIQDKVKYKIPQTGWNTVDICKQSPLLTGITNRSEFYFLHSYHYVASNQQDVLTKTDYQYPFVSAVAKDHIFGTQFHPEKSHDSGMQLLRNFIQL